MRCRSIRPLDDHAQCVLYAFTHLGFWRMLYDCSWHHFTAEKCVSNVLSLHLRRSPTVLLQIEGRLFEIQLLELVGVVDQGMAHSIAYPRFLLSSHWHMRSISYHSELFIWLQKRFRPFFRPSNPDTMRNTALEAIVSPSGKLVRQYPRDVIGYLRGFSNKVVFGPRSAVNTQTGSITSQIKLQSSGAR